MRVRGLLGSLLSTLAISMAVACADGDTTGKEDRLCTPGAYVFCRCADRAEGTKLCQADGRSFEACTTSASGGCVGGEIPDPRTNEEIPSEQPGPGHDEPANALDRCPGKSTAVIPGVELRLEGDTASAAIDREGRAGACAVGAGAKDHVYRLISSGSGQLEVKVQGSAGLVPVAYLRTTCDDKESQIACGPPGGEAVTQLKANVKTGTSYFLVVDGASSSAGKYVATIALTTKAFCGDGKVDNDEACDDGGHAEDDGCSADCRRVDGNPAAGGSCPGHPVHVWPGQTATGTGSTSGYGNAWDKPSAACDPGSTNAYQDHIYEVTPHATGPMTVTVTPTTATNFMLSARRSCAEASTTASMCKNDVGVSAAAETMTINVTNNQKIYVAVDGGGITGNQGNYTISFKLP